MLIVLNGANDDVISIEGRSNTTEDLNGEDFPWTPRPVIEDLKSLKLYDSEKVMMEFEDLKGKTFSLFFHCHILCMCYV